MQYGLIGEKLSHSFSAMIHGDLADYEYELLAIPRDELDDFMRRRDFRGLNVTIPYKQAVMPYCDEISDAALKIGSVNTLLMRTDGTLFGDNTDYAGFLALAEKTGISFSGKNVLVLGSGGTSRTVCAAVSNSGAASVTVCSRTGECNYGNVYELGDVQIIVNTTPLGMYPNNGEKAVELKKFPKLEGVLDVVYNPLKTALVLEAEKLGVPASGGLYMLVSQAKRASEIFTGQDIPTERVDEIFAKLKSGICNLVFTGMPGCGKSTIGRACAERLGREFIDMDAFIEERAGMTIPDIFSKHGEKMFRGLETEAAREIGNRTGLVIATGGGAVLRGENTDALRQNGTVVRLRRDITALSTDGRPLSTSLERLMEMERERDGFYKAASDFEVINDADIDTVCEKVLAGFLAL